METKVTSHPFEGPGEEQEVTVRRLLRSRVNSGSLPRHFLRKKK
jgi:hypothetical protein